MFTIIMSNGLQRFFVANKCIADFIVVMIIILNINTDTNTYSYHTIVTINV